MNIYLILIFQKTEKLRRIFKKMEKFELKTLESNKIKISHPARILFVGVSMSGKSTVINNFIKNQSVIFQKPFHRIILSVPTASYSMLHEKQYNDLKKYHDNVEFLTGFPIFSELFNENNKNLNTCLIMEEFLAHGNFANKSEALELFTAKSHHYNTTILITTQSYYFEGKYARNMRKQMTDIVLFKSRGDKGDLTNLTRQIFPTSPNYLKKCLQFVEDNCNKDNQFILIDNNPISEIPENLQVRCNLIPKETNDEPEIIFLVPYILS